MPFEVPAIELMNDDIRRRHHDALKGARRWLPGVRRSSTEYRSAAAAARRATETLIR
ncbi:hypothetical protein [Cumulibacter manganitolerans]|uniref:hypothetical protein n=1 Tax=Cumulibacter manganitolerans TaxID=1884992 RepID=UPI00188618D6|nr:hypothetical protein [Cumulibacter manganitolerans]